MFPLEGEKESHGGANRLMLRCGGVGSVGRIATFIQEIERDRDGERGRRPPLLDLMIGWDGWGGRGRGVSGAWTLESAAGFEGSLREWTAAAWRLVSPREYAAVRWRWCCDLSDWLGWACAEEVTGE